MTVYLAMENRKFHAWEISTLIEGWRKKLGWKQEYLADAANVSLRTVERAMAGKESDFPGEASLKRIAKALGLEEDAFTKEYQFKSEEEIKKEQEELKKEYTIIKLTRAETGKILIEDIKAYHLLAKDYLESSNKDLEKLMFSFFEYAKELSWETEFISGDYERECKNELSDYIEKFKTHNYAIYRGMTEKYIVHDSKETKPTKVSQWVVNICPDTGGEMESYVPKKQKVNFEH